MFGENFAPPKQKKTSTPRLWQLIQSLPPLISSSAPSETTEGAILHFTKKTAIELLGRKKNDGKSGGLKKRDTPPFSGDALLVFFLLEKGPDPFFSTVFFW